MPYMIDGVFVKKVWSQNSMRPAFKIFHSGVANMLQCNHFHNPTVEIRHQSIPSVFWGHLVSIYSKFCSRRFASQTNKQLSECEKLIMEKEMASSMMSSPAVTTVNRGSMVAPFSGLKSMAGFPVRKTKYDITSIASNTGRVQCINTQCK